MTNDSNTGSSWPFYDEEQIEAVEAVLRSGKVNYWTGEQGHLFEQEYADFVGCRRGIALANGSVALDLALYALGIGPGDDVVTTSRTYIASASSIVLAGARPIFADVDANSQNLTLESVSAAVTPATRAIIAVHLAGWPCPMDELMAFAEERGISIVEDCAQAHGASYRGRQVGSMGQIGAFSFCQDKIMTTGGEGGMVVTDDEQLWSKMWSYKDHGKSFEAMHEARKSTGFRWVHHSFGTNWRMTEMQAALGRIQLRRLREWTEMRRRNATRIWETARKCAALRVPEILSYIEHAAYKCYVFVRPELLKNGWDRDRIMSAINERGVPCYSGSCSEVYLEQAFDAAGLKPLARLPVARELGETSLMLLVHPNLTALELDRCCETLQQVMSQATQSESEGLISS